jgi:hypothetical protein
MFVAFPKFSSHSFLPLHLTIKQGTFNQHAMSTWSVRCLASHQHVSSRNTLLEEVLRKATPVPKWVSILPWMTSNTHTHTHSKGSMRLPFEQLQIKNLNQILVQPLPLIACVIEGNSDNIYGGLLLCPKLLIISFTIHSDPWNSSCYYPHFAD